MTAGGPHPSSTAPLDGADLDALFAAWQNHPHKDRLRIALAVSGGADSMALMVLAHSWASRCPSPPDLTVLTVDHRLRVESQGEAAWVKEQAGRLGLRHEILPWTGPKPRTGIQAAARAARYGLMFEFCRGAGIDVLATAHTAEDQAETLLMRLARGSGLDGLAAISPVTVRDGLTLSRPLLSIPRARLKASLEARGRSWLEDPSNRDTRFERVRMREALSTAKALHLAPEKLSLSARRLDRAQLALDAITAGFLRAGLQIHPAGYGEMPLAALRETEEEIAIRAIALMASIFGGGQRPVRLARIETLHAALIGSDLKAATLGGCLFAPRGSTLRAVREFGRIAPIRTPVPSPGRLLWDGRFAVMAPTGEGLTIGALGAEGVAHIRASGGRAPLPAQVAHSLPALWRGEKLMFAPFAQFPGDKPAGWVSRASAVFVGAARLGSEAGANHIHKAGD
jgi:tRNA(Ile)-lysidine synthase